MINNMIYIFGISLIYTMIKKKDQLLGANRNLILFLLLSIIGLTLGIIYIINPYLPSIAAMLEKHMK
ncbi:MAG: hypothetical protein E7255_03640 [Lachnospiraceae bacterium]|nr:hypothetical protein [Lachnospiraceae bacterium]